MPGNNLEALVLDEYRELFKDDDAFAFFVDAFRSRISDWAPVLSKEEILGAVMSPEMTKEMLCGRIIQKLVQSPKTLDEIRERLEGNDIVD
ncbi:MAG: hypothetical protein KDA60_00930 [Planctomycetales bacterium]|nr:hypothetical protein [Planctomycetales bacterium]